MHDYLTETGREVEEIYEAGGWTTLRRRARLVEGDDEAAEALSERLGRLLHVDEPARLAAYLGAGPLAGNARFPATLGEVDRRRLEMLDAQLWERGELPIAEETLRKLTELPAILGELDELRVVLEERISLASQIFPVPEWPLALHHQYMRREILTAVGFTRPGKKKHVVPSGILKVEDRQCELLFVTLDKSGTDFSPTTRYRDYAISRDRFHWETQGSASASRPSGRRYIESPGNGMTFQLFVRTTSDDPFAYLGPVLYEGHKGDRPIAITWRLEHAMPAGLFERYATLVTT